LPGPSGEVSAGLRIAAVTITGIALLMVSKVPTVSLNPVKHGPHLVRRLAKLQQSFLFHIWYPLFSPPSLFSVWIAGLRNH
jgi:hypothetical protein